MRTEVRRVVRFEKLTFYNFSKCKLRALVGLFSSKEKIFILGFALFSMAEGSEDFGKAECFRHRLKNLVSSYDKLYKMNPANPYLKYFTPPKIEKPEKQETQSRYFRRRKTTPQVTNSPRLLESFRLEDLVKDLGLKNEELGNDPINRTLEFYSSLLESEIKVEFSKVYSVELMALQKKLFSMDPKNPLISFVEFKNGFAYFPKSKKKEFFAYIETSPWDKDNDMARDGFSEYQRVLEIEIDRISTGISVVDFEDDEDIG